MTAAQTLRPEDIVQGQFDAYNAQDLDAHCAFFADDVVVADLNGDVTIRGMDAYRAKYTQVFADFPKNRAELGKDAAMDVIIPFSIAIVLDGILQYLSLGYVRPLAAVVMGILLIWVPFSVSRALTNRIYRRSHQDQPAVGST